MVVSPPGSSVHGILQARIPQWVAIPLSRASSWPRNRTQVSWIAGRFSGFPYFLQFKSEFCNKEFMIWATLSSWSCFCWLYIASLSLTANNIINLIQFWASGESMYTVIPCVVGRKCLLWPVRSLGKTLLYFALLHFVLQGLLLFCFPSL